MENEIMVQHYMHLCRNIGLRSSHFPRLTIHSHPVQIHHCPRHVDKIICSDVLSAASGNRASFAKERAVLEQCDAVMGMGVRVERTSQGRSAQRVEVCHWITDLVLLKWRNFASLYFVNYLNFVSESCKCILVFYVFENMWFLNINKPLNCTWNFYQLSSYIHHS